MSARHTAYYNLLDALAAPRCGLCTLGYKAIDRFFDNMLYEYVNDTGMQEMIAASHGLCSTHSELLLDYRGALGVAILYHAVLRHLEDDLPPPNESSDTSRRRIFTGRNGSLPIHSERCPACAIRDETTLRAIREFDAHHAEPELVSVWQSSNGLCLPHLNQALSELGSPARTLVINRQREVWARLRAALEEFIRKNDYRFQEEGFTETESRSWQDVVRATAGEPGIF
jgi:hypothetical protein